MYIFIIVNLSRNTFSNNSFSQIPNCDKSQSLIMPGFARRHKKGCYCMYTTQSQLPDHLRLRLLEAADRRTLYSTGQVDRPAAHFFLLRHWSEKTLDGNPRWYTLHFPPFFSMRYTTKRCPLRNFFKHKSCLFLKLLAYNRCFFLYFCLVGFLLFYLACCLKSFHPSARTP